jgi:hypothetical protein
MKNEMIVEKLKKLARRECYDEDSEFIPYDAFGGNMDDAYAGGQEDGETQLARELLTELGVSWK